MKIAILGFGTVGSGVLEVLTKNAQLITKQAREPIEVKYILDIRDFSTHPNKQQFVKEINQIVNDEEVEVVVEAMGGLDPAYKYTKECLEKGKSVVTPNKELVASYGPELIGIAMKKKTKFLFEASVGGGIPIIRPLKEALGAEEVHEIVGILNGTTNFILTKMAQEERDFSDVLKEAQLLGYAERHPEADIEGYDACRKIAILASLALGQHIDFNEVETKGITTITAEDIIYAKNMGMKIKLLATMIKRKNQLFVNVGPTMIPNEHPLAVVDGVFNAVLVKGNMVGDIMFYGQGAGKLPTASAIVADLIEVSNKEKESYSTGWSKEKLDVSPAEDLQTCYFVRLQGEVSYIKKSVKEVFGDVKQIEECLAEEYAFITPIATKGILEEKMKDLRECIQLSKIPIHCEK